MTDRQRRKGFAADTADVYACRWPQRGPARPPWVVLVATLLLAALAVPDGIAQSQLFQTYGASYGLHNLNVKCLAQDHIGYIWVGTDNGLFRFDSTRFREFGHQDGLINTEVFTVSESPSGVLWVGTNGGVAILSGESFHMVEIGEQGATRNIVFTSKGDIYLQGDFGIVRGHASGVGNYAFRKEVSAPVNGLSVQGNRIFFGREGGVWTLTEDAVSEFAPSSSLPRDQWSAMVGDTLGNQWVRSRTRLYELPRGQTRFVDRSSHVPHAEDTHLYADNHGGVFVSTLAGTIVMSGGRRSFFDARHGMPADPSGPLLIDRDQLLWMGTDGGGLVRRLGHGEWLAWRKDDGLLANTVWAVKRDERGKVWIGTSGGLTILDANGVVSRTWNAKSGLAGDRVLSLLEAPSGDFYVGTDVGGMSHFNREGQLLSSYGKESGYLAESVSAMALDRQGRLWAIGRGGCFRSLSPVEQGRMRFERIDIPGMPGQAALRDLLFDDRGEIWIASSQGLAHFDGTGWRILSGADGLKSMDLGVVSQVGNAIWVGYRDALGMTTFDLPNLSPAHISVRDGIASDQVYAIKTDRKQRVWVSTDAGVSVLEDGKWKNYSSDDGLIWNDTDSLALSIDGQDNVWIGTSGGLAEFAQLEFPVVEQYPPVVLTSVTNGSRQWSANDKPTLSYENRSLSIGYAALSYDAQSTSRFRYRLVGLDDNWTETSEQRVAFAALPSGHYMFEVSAVGPNGQWNPSTARFSFSIRSPWWKTWWFITSSLLAVALITAAIIRLRIRALETQKTGLEQQVADRTAELVSSHRRLEEIAYRDMLTDTWNRRMFVEELRGRMNHALHAPFILLLLDLDFFKQVNDKFGHDAGDAVLIATATRLKDEIRQSDLVARLGGDEFAILMSDTRDDAATEDLCLRLLGSLSIPVLHRDMSLTVASSIGIARYPTDGETQESLYKSADLALYRAKQSGRNAFRWHRSEQHRTKKGAGEVDPISTR